MHKKLKELVIAEATNLRKYATTRETKRLNLETLDGNFEDKCVYGQMTGNCFSNRANELIRRCCERVYKVDHISGTYISDSKLNGKPYKVNGAARKFKYFSPIEKALYKGMTEKQKRDLITFIKGEIDTLTLNPK